jgi:HEAT repeat protein
VIEALTWGSLSLAAVGSLFVAALAARRVLVARVERKRVETEARLTPVALDLLNDEPVELGRLDAAETEILAAVLSRYSAQLRGAETDRIAEFFEQRGGLRLEQDRLRDRRAWRRAAAAFALGNMGSRGAASTLLASLSDRDGAVRAAAARSLGRLGVAEAVEPLVYGFSRRELSRAVVGQALLAIGPAALPALRGMEDAPDAEARAFAVELIGLLGDATDGRRVMRRLVDASAEVRAKAARALGRLGAAEAAETLVTALDDRIVFVRVSAAHALAAVGDIRAVPALLRIARTDEFDAARAAAEAAARLDPDAVVAAAAVEGAGPHLAEAADLVVATR